MFDFETFKTYLAELKYGKKGKVYFPPDSEQREMAVLYMWQPFKTSNFIGHLYVTALLLLGLFVVLVFLPTNPVSSWYPKLKAKLLSRFFPGF